MSRYETQIASTASDDQEIAISYNGGMCATITTSKYNAYFLDFDANERDLTAIINELTVVRDAIRSVKRVSHTEDCDIQRSMGMADPDCRAH